MNKTRFATRLSMALAFLSLISFRINPLPGSNPSPVEAASSAVEGRNANWKLDEIRDLSTLGTEVISGPTRVSESGVSLDVWQVKFNSIDLGGGSIRMYGVVARPSEASPRSLPAFIYGNESSVSGKRGTPLRARVNTAE
ncbi:MAG: hypothetical protein HY650_09900 [Acidobacteria bacterium]|nr:hypothetical protein [Acidobacteriota bacterium]